MNNLKYAPDEYTKVEGASIRSDKSGIRPIESVTRGFNEGISHMYANPVEQEMMIIQKAAVAQAELEQRLGLSNNTRRQVQSIL